MDFIEKISAEKIFAVLRMQEKNRTRDIINALTDGGINIIEMVIDTPEMVSLLQEITKKDERPLIMAGGIITQRQAQIVIDAGADIIVSPIFQMNLVRLCKSQPTFLKKGTGGFFKDRNPNVDILTLEEKWVDRTEILYIGKAGGGTSSSTLYKRIKQYLDFGNGKKVGHWGGRYIWQLQDSDDLYFCWKETQTGNLPREEETSLITIFKESHEGKLPFANLTE